MCRRIPIFQVQSKHIMLNDYYALRNGETTGPFSHTELMEQGLEPDTQVYSPLTNAWDNAAEIPEFNRYFESIGINMPTQANVANFWWRLLAYIIDYIIFLVAIMACAFLLAMLTTFLHAPMNIFNDEDNTYELKLRLLSFVGLTLYNAAFESTRLQASIGKLICRLKVVDGMGRRITFFNALGRNVGKILSSLLCGAGFLAIFWNNYHQAWHDGVAKTYVIRQEGN